MKGFDDAVFAAIKGRRTVRLFEQRPIGRQTILDIIDCARYYPSAANKQPVRFYIVDGEERDSVFECLSWARNVSPRRTPKEGQRPAAYIVVLTDETVSIGEYAMYDVGAAVNNILLVAFSLGIGSCWLGAIDRDRLSTILSIGDAYKIHAVVALGFPAEEPKAVEAKGGDTLYFIDGQGRLCIPKLPLKEVVLNYA